MADELEENAEIPVAENSSNPSNDNVPSNPYQMGGLNVSRITVLTDDDLVSKKPVQWSGFALKCKQCGTPAILHFMKYCGECGEAVSVQSKTANEYIKNLQDKYNE